MMVGAREIPAVARHAQNGRRRRRRAAPDRRRAAWSRTTPACPRSTGCARGARRRDRRHRRRLGQRPARAGRGAGRPAPATRRARSASAASPTAPRGDADPRHRVFSLPEEPLRNACVPQHERGREHGAPQLRPAAARRRALWLRRGALRAQAARWIARLQGEDAGRRTRRSATLSGGNVQRAVLARELSEPVSVLIAANPGLRPRLRGGGRDPRPDPRRAQRGAAVLLVSEDLDEMLELSDRIVVMFDGTHRARDADRAAPTSR